MSPTCCRCDRPGQLLIKCVLAVLIGLIPLVALPARAGGPDLDPPVGRHRAAIDRLVAGLRAEDGGGHLRLGIWFGGPTGEPWYATEPDASLPAASAIKTAILVELFARFAQGLDRVPPDLDDHLRDESPTIVHYPPDARAEARRELTGKTVRQLGGIMMEPIPASNVVYNAAASVSIALLGGPEATTRAIQARDPAFTSIFVRRYMLADRTRLGDNTATPTALAAVLRRVVAGQLAGLDAATITAIRRSILARVDAQGQWLIKDGLLESDPIAVIRTGSLTPASGLVQVFAVMLARDHLGNRPRDEEITRLKLEADRLVATILDDRP